MAVTEGSVKRFVSKLHVELNRKADSGYEEARQIWNRTIDR